MVPKEIGKKRPLSDTLTVETCSTENCQKKRYCKGLCRSCLYPCAIEGCSNRKEIDEYCRAHTLRKICSTENCPNRADVRKDYCRKCLQPCAFEGCAKGRHIGNYCSEHSTARCTTESCGNKAFTTTGLCRKCAYTCIIDGCLQGRQHGNFCHRHAELPGCQTTGCPNKAQNNQGLCKACAYSCVVEQCKAERKFGEYCPKHANLTCTRCQFRRAYYKQDNTIYLCQSCRDPCNFPGCNSGADHSTRGTGIKGRCKKHGGGDRCEGACCQAHKDEATSAAHYHPHTNQGMCRAWARSIVADLRDRHQHDEAEKMFKYFGFNRELAYRGEQVFYWSMAKMLPILNNQGVFKICLDRPASTININDRPKNLRESRPDYFHVYGKGPDAFALLGEFDEDIEHEDSAGRICNIARFANIPIGRIFVYRILARRNTDDELFRMRQRNRVRFTELTDKGHETVKKVVEYLQECIRDMINGIPPDVGPGEFSCMYFFHADGEVRMEHKKRIVR